MRTIFIAMSTGLGLGELRVCLRPCRSPAATSPLELCDVWRGAAARSRAVARASEEAAAALDE